MKKFFNTTGPIEVDEHYCIDPLSRVDWAEIQYLIQTKRYFVFHAPRQSGKTSTLLAIEKQLRQSGDYIALYANIEAAQSAGRDPQTAIPIVCQTMADQAQASGVCMELTNITKKRLAANVPGAALAGILTDWAQHHQKPIVLIIDEVDALMGNSLISLLRQIRSGYTQRPNAFPQSIILCGVRDVKDYRIHGDGEIIAGGSAFNIKAASMRIGDFNQSQIIALYNQHTEQTGQAFEETIFAAIWQDTQGQPWLVNALGYEMVHKQQRNRDRSKTITLYDYQEAKESLIHSRATHLDQLSDKLKEPRVRTVISPIIEGSLLPNKYNGLIDDLQYVEDLGLIKLKPQLQIANGIYKEIIPRELTYPTQVTIDHQQSWYVTANNHLDTRKLLKAFQQFYRESADTWLARFDYHEAGPQLLLQAFLHRVIDDGGRIQREYALGSARTDLFIEWPITELGFCDKVQRIVIEIKMLRSDFIDCKTKGIEQLLPYADRVNADEAHLVIFDATSDHDWSDKIIYEQEFIDGCMVDVWGC